MVKEFDSRGSPWNLRFISIFDGNYKEETKAGVARHIVGETFRDYISVIREHGNLLDDFDHEKTDFGFDRQFLWA